MRHPSLIALTLLLCSVLSAGTGALAQQVAGPSGAANANGATDSTLEIPPNYPEPSSTAQPGSSDAGAANTQSEVQPGTAQDYAGNQGPDTTTPPPNFAGIDDYMNQQASYESLSTGLPTTALLPPYAYYPYSPYYYPRFYSPPPPILMMPPPSRPVIVSPKIRTPVHPPPAYHPPPPPPPPAHHFSFGPPSGHGGFPHR